MEVDPWYLSKLRVETTDKVRSHRCSQETGADYSAPLRVEFEMWVDRATPTVRLLEVDNADSPKA